MITGLISGRHALVRLTVRGPFGREVEVETTLDTGFVGFLTLPPSIVEALKLNFISPQPASLADGSQVMLEIYQATVIWDGEERDIDVLAMNGNILLGMSLLAGCDVQLHVTDGGPVTIEPF